MNFSLPEFAPRGLWRNPDVQSIVASVPLRRPFVERRTRKILGMSRIEMVECYDGVRLKCLRTAQPDPNAPVAVLIHGWLGGADSLYMLSASDELHKAGFEVWRLQMRDHGDTHDLNKGIFHSCRIDEVVSAVGVIQKMIGGRPLCLGGFSLGANFSLRIAVRADEANLDIAQVVAMCPVLHPPATLDALEAGPRAYNYYFMRKWRRALRLKHQSWPDVYDIDEIRRHDTMRDLTEHLVTEYSHFPDLMSYLNGYSIIDEVLAPLTVPTLLVAAQDDPIIPATDLDRLARPESLAIHLTELGGHVGYLYTATGPTWADDVLVRCFSAASGIQRGEPAQSAHSDAAWKENMYRLYDYLPSGNSYKARLLLALLGTDYERIDVDIMKGETRTPDFLAKNPNGRIPMLQLENGEFVWESNAILYYLARLGTSYMPRDPLPAAQVMQWMFFEQYSHEPFIAVARFILMHTDENHPRRAELEAKWIGGYAALDVMEKHLADRDYFVGVSLTIADIALYAYTHVADEGGFDLASYPNVRAWLTRVADRPGHILITDA